MCKAFSCIISQKKKVTWKLNMDNHHKLIDLARYKDNEDTKRFIRIEIIPKNNNYISPDKWTLKIDESEMPRWWSPSHEQAVWDAHKVWMKELYKILIKNKKIIHPFKDIKMIKKVTVKHKLLLKEWDSVRGSVRDSVWDSVGDSVWGSVRGSVRDSVGDRTCPKF